VDFTLPDHQQWRRLRTLGRNRGVGDNLVITPPKVSTPKDSGVTSNSKMPVHQQAHQLESLHLQLQLHSVNGLVGVFTQRPLDYIHCAGVRVNHQPRQSSQSKVLQTWRVSASYQVLRTILVAVINGRLISAWVTLDNSILLCFFGGGVVGLVCPYAGQCLLLSEVFSW